MEFGNLLSLPVSGGLLYVEPVYVRATQGQGYPLLRKVLVSFGNTSVMRTPSPRRCSGLLGDSFAPGGEEEPTRAPPTHDAEADLAVRGVMPRRRTQQGEEALKPGDFEAYGVAQQQLKAALDRAAEAQSRLGARPREAPRPARASTATREPAAASRPASPRRRSRPPGRAAGRTITRRRAVARGPGHMLPHDRRRSPAGRAHMAEAALRTRGAEHRSASARLGGARRSGDSRIAQKGLRKGSVSIVAAVAIGLAATAPAYSLTGALGYGAAESGYQLPIVFVDLGHPDVLRRPGLPLHDHRRRRLGTVFTWGSMAIGPRVGWLGGWGLYLSSTLAGVGAAEIVVNAVSPSPGWRSRR